MDGQQPLPIIVIGSVLVGWAVAKFAAYIASKFTGARRDPKEAQIRSLKAELRVAQSISEKQGEQLETKTQQLEAAQKLVHQQRDVVVRHEVEVTRLTEQLKRATGEVRELKAELKTRKAEHARVLTRLQELETEISMVRASSTLFPNGIENYSDDDEEQQAASAGS